MLSIWRMYPTTRMLKFAYPLNSIQSMSNGLTYSSNAQLLAATVETVEHLPEGNRKLLHYIVAFLASSSPGPRAVSEMAIAVAPAVIRYVLHFSWLVAAV